jgi:hypothetical protein
MSLKLLLEAAEADVEDCSGQTPLAWAAGNGHEAVVKLLLEAGADVESKDGDGRMIHQLRYLTDPHLIMALSSSPCLSSCLWRLVGAIRYADL